MRGPNPDASNLLPAAQPFCAHTAEDVGFDVLLKVYVLQSRGSGPRAWSSTLAPPTSALKAERLVAVPAQKVIMQSQMSSAGSVPMGSHWRPLL